MFHVKHLAERRGIPGTETIGLDEHEGQPDGKQGAALFSWEDGNWFWFFPSCN